MNTLGQRVTILEDGTKEAGIHQVEWAGTNELGIDVPSGLYFVSLKAGDFQQTIKILKTK